MIAQNWNFASLLLKFLHFWKDIFQQKAICKHCKHSDSLRLYFFIFFYLYVPVQFISIQFRLKQLF